MPYDPARGKFYRTEAQKAARKKRESQPKYKQRRREKWKSEHVIFNTVRGVRPELTAAQIQERDDAYSRQSPTDALMGVPPPGRSALDRMNA